MTTQQHSFGFHASVIVLGAAAVSLSVASWSLHERAAWLEQAALRDPDLKWQIDAIDSLHLEHVIYRLWSTLPKALRPGQIDTIATTAESYRTQRARQPVVSWLARLAASTWSTKENLSKRPVSIDRVMPTLYEKASLVNQISLRTVQGNLNLRNKLATYCGHKPVAYESICADVLADPLLGTWNKAFADDEMAKGLRPYLVRSDLAKLGMLVTTRFSICNLAPYATRFVVGSMAQPGVLETNGWMPLAAGDCAEMTRDSVDAAPELAFAADSVEPQSVQFVASHINAGATSSEVHWRGSERGDTRACVGDLARFTERGQARSCPTRTEAVRLLGVNTWDASGPHVLLTHPGSRLDGLNAATESTIQSQVALIAQGVRRQVAFGTQWAGRPLHYFLGPELIDSNGVFAEGVTLSHVPPTTIFDDQNPLIDGDDLIELNGRPIFSSSDLALTVIEHAQSLAGGAEVAMRAVVIRGGLRKSVTASFMFNSQVFGHDHAIAAAAFGIVDPFFFSQTPDAICRAPHVIHALTSGLNWLGTVLCKASDGQDCEGKPIAPAPTEAETATCVWQWKQKRALSRQTNGDAFSAGAWVGIALPGPLRLGLSGRVNNLAIKVAGRSRLAPALGTAALEASESFVQELLAPAPTTETSIRVGNARRAAVFATGIGFVVGGVLAH